ncbi:Suf-domain-containing protein [Xylona heveae TC161]|uniref:mRNA 3'-end-processing protein RNA14 n=1 Tax=Xylona heveae (strain CBS 132557 / TC161) TaxID=1328760 RepID=A0A164ZAA0_XYLHT|nr:Suf-domain-containing protein [Xylona heveae TC161]KZF18863.1 Suf-domain-containing protein [Xylona heveae TC161]
MGDINAELALLDSMQAMNEAAGNFDGSLEEDDQQREEASSDEYDPSRSFNDPSNENSSGIEQRSPQQDAHENVASVTQVAELGSRQAQSPPSGELVSSAHSQASSGETSQSPTRQASQPIDHSHIVDEKPGGFEDGREPPLAGESGLLNVAQGSSYTPQRSLSHTPINAYSSEDVSIQNAAHGQGAPDTVPNSVAGVPDVSSNDDSFSKSAQSLTAPNTSVNEQQYPTISVGTASKARLPNDRVGILEDRIKEDPRGDMDAWLSLISEHRRRNKIDEARTVYERFLKRFPLAAEQWIAYAQMELQNNEFYLVEQIFSKSLLTVPNVQLWSVYLDYVRRRNNLTTDSSGTARQIVAQAYDFVLQNIGIDKDAGAIWQDHIRFIRSGPGTIGGNSWQDQQKMDLLRKTYQRAICAPNQAVNAIWKEYDSFEMGLNKVTGRKFLQEKSPAYVSARSSFTELQNITRDLVRTTLPRLPPALGFEGDTEYLKQIELWKKWIQWEKDDPLVLKEEDISAYRARILYVFKQSVMALSFWPEMWFEAAEFCFQNELDKEGNEFISQGIDMNPESCLLAFKYADWLEIQSLNDEGEDTAKRRGAIVREPYDRVLDALYELIAKTKAREAKDLARIEEAFPHQVPINQPRENDEDADAEDDFKDPESSAYDASKKAQKEAVQNGALVQIRLLSRTVSFAWIALMRAMRRIQGKGKVGDVVGGSRQIFTDARKRGRLTSDVYVASALIEYHCYKDPAATKIFERGMKLFPEDEDFALEYLKHLIAINDITNARAVFETTVNKLAQRAETLQKAKPIYAFFHEYESQYGELSQVGKLEKRMSDLFPEDPQLQRFARRFVGQGFDPTAIRPLISPATQARPKAILSIEPPESVQNTPPVRFAQVANSPKRPLPVDDSDTEMNRPRKLNRGESPLKGAAGRRLDQQKRNRQREMIDSQGQLVSAAVPPPALPREVLFLLSIIPRAETYHATRFKPEGMVRLLRDAHIPTSLPSSRPVPMIPPGHMNGSYQFGR